ncbi:hypothetical protein EUBDOL_02022 [Amedibacillus dolichus DSM 3991]|uniref:Uncharacterized protein n=1 Tax=Amedibacillus dolichus DSM 3991 TaxID=428127 RepID=A8RDQ5_9FIRM|nr:hypothetical protein EUBDOL_02022 [Amedibacillus dolichus DSM 3991]
MGRIEKNMFISIALYYNKTEMLLIGVFCDWLGGMDHV